MRIWFVAPECAPFAKVGGLGDVTGALPKALTQLGHDVRVLLPRYGFIDRDGFSASPTPLGVPVADGTLWCGVLSSVLPHSSTPIELIEHDALFSSPSVYRSPGMDMFDAARFGLLCRAALQLAKDRDQIPDVIHLHDWPTAWLPLLVNTVEAGAFQRTATVFTIHNIAHQPRFSPDALGWLGTGYEHFRSDGYEDHGLVNVFKGGAYHSTMLSTVSPRYAWEIRTPEGGAGLHDVMEFRGADLVGILNGIDDDVWNPATDRHLPASYSLSDLSGKAKCKAELQAELQLDVRPDVPLLGMITRLTDQKGVDVLIAILEDLLALDTQVVVLGTGDPYLEGWLGHRSFFGGGRFAARIAYDEGLAHRIEAGSDFFLMPSRFEPCGLNQMYSQRYGTLPIVHAVGGLDDTVEQCDPAHDQGTGFKSWSLSPSAYFNTARWAVDVFRNAPEVYRAMQRRSMEKDMSWRVAAARYEELYEWSLERRGVTGVR